MLQKIDSVEFKFVIQLLDRYIQQKFTHQLLIVWSKLKQKNLNIRHRFSNASFAKPNPQTQNYYKRKPTTQSLNTRGQTTRHQTQYDQSFQWKNSSQFKGYNQSNFRSKALSQCDFQGKILDRLIYLQQKLQRTKSKSSSICNDSFGNNLSEPFTSRSKTSNQQGLGFTMSPKFIPMNMNGQIKKVQSFVCIQESEKCPAKGHRQQFQFQTKNRRVEQRNEPYFKRNRRQNSRILPDQIVKQPQQKDDGNISPKFCSAQSQIKFQKYSPSIIEVPISFNSTQRQNLSHLGNNQRNIYVSNKTKRSFKMIN